MTKEFLTIAIILTLGITPAQAQTPAKDSFPGVGDKTAWLKANSFFAEGNHLMSAKRWDAAIAKYQEAIASYPADAHYHYNLGFALKRKGDLPAAVEALKRSVEVDAKDWKSWKLLGNCYYALGSLPEAKQAFEKTLLCSLPPKEVAQLKAGIAACKARSK